MTKSLLPSIAGLLISITLLNPVLAIAASDTYESSYARQKLYERIAAFVKEAREFERRKGEEQAGAQRSAERGVAGPYRAAADNGDEAAFLARMGSEHRDARLELAVARQSVVRDARTDVTNNIHSRTIALSSGAVGLTIYMLAAAIASSVGYQSAFEVLRNEGFVQLMNSIDFSSGDFIQFMMTPAALALGLGIPSIGLSIFFGGNDRIGGDIADVIVMVIKSFIALAALGGYALFAVPSFIAFVSLNAASLDGYVPALIASSMGTAVSVGVGLGINRSRALVAGALASKAEVKKGLAAAGLSAEDISWFEAHAAQDVLTLKAERCKVALTPEASATAPSARFISDADAAAEAEENERGSRGRGSRRR